ncbi:MAG: peroxidase, partial [Pseudomonadota bacterium]|nr:peroxidase [Pseudomonadota bacterium]
VRAAGWSDQALNDAILVCALHNFMNRWVDGAGVDADDETLSDRGIFLAEEGYSKKNADIQPEAA